MAIMIMLFGMKIIIIPGDGRTITAIMKEENGLIP